MSRAALGCLCVAALGLAGLGALAFVGHPVLGAYLTAWQLVLALPLGALPLVMAAEGLGQADEPVMRSLRAVLTLMPAAAVMAFPILFGWQTLYPTNGAQPASEALRVWATPEIGIIRSVVSLVVWTALALIFRTSRDRPPRIRLAVLGLALHFVMATVAATDWVGGVDPGLGSSSLGLLVVAAQCGLAYGVACLRTAWLGGKLGPPHALALALLAAIWLFLQFTQYLVVWSANLPEEIGWYIARGGIFGGALEIGAIGIALLAIACGAMRPGSRMLVAIAAMLALVHVVEWFWFIAPAGSGGFGLGGTDLLALLAAAGLLGATALFDRTGPVGGRHSHGI